MNKYTPLLRLRRALSYLCIMALIALIALGIYSQLRQQNLAYKEHIAKSTQ
jgi:hypothetical protein